MRARAIKGIVFSLAVLLTMQPNPIWAVEGADSSGATDVTISGAATDTAPDAKDNPDEDNSKPLDQTGTSHLPTLLLIGGMLCGGGAIALRERKRIADGSDDQQC